MYYKVKGIWKKYYDNDDETLTLCAADTIFTYFQDKIGITHYLLFVGDNATGKSNALRILNNLAYRPLFGTSITPANIYNFLGSWEEGQGIILEDEIDNIEEQKDKMRIYNGGYTSGTKVTRMYEYSSGGRGGWGSKSNKKQQQSYFTYCFKAFSSERLPTFYNAKGFHERIFVINCIAGNPQYDILEVENDAGDLKYEKLLREIRYEKAFIYI